MYEEEMIDFGVIMNDDEVEEDKEELEDVDGSVDGDGVLEEEDEEEDEEDEEVAGDGFGERE